MCNVRCKSQFSTFATHRQFTAVTSHPKMNSHSKNIKINLWMEVDINHIEMRSLRSPTAAPHRAANCTQHTALGHSFVWFKHRYHHGFASLCSPFIQCTLSNRKEINIQIIKMGGFTKINNKFTDKIPEYQ
jgi:hypothetical protein